MTRDELRAAIIGNHIVRRLLSIRQETSRKHTATVVSICLCALAHGCSRLQHLEQADRDAYSNLNLNSYIDAWSAPTDISVLPIPESRLFDPTPIDAPLLPDPVPRLHSYEIPPGIGQQPNAVEELPAPMPVVSELMEFSHRPRDGLSNDHTPNQTPNGLRNQWQILLLRLQVQDKVSGAVSDLDISPVTIPKSAWESIPPKCRMRMFEFDRIRTEYEDSYGRLPPITERDASPRLSFDDVLHLALLNSREYQSQKEQLYRVALRLSLQQYEYQLKFAPFGNQTGVRYETRDSSINSLSQLNVPSSAQLQALLGTGSTLVTRFANDVLMTFNGPDGFAADIGSELLFELTHSVYQNDVRFEGLTQAERNVVYAARDFARFRRTFYLQLATQYYNLLRNYRQVEIDSQNYISLVRAYSQRDIEFSEGAIARVQIDQVEQNALAGRSSLIGTCNSLENSLDELKIQTGLPTETPINMDLSELTALTVSDEVSAKLELVRRTEGRLTAHLSRENPDDAIALNLAAELVARMLEASELQQRQKLLLPIQPSSEKVAPPKPIPDASSQPSPANKLHELALLQSWLHVLELRVFSERRWQHLETERKTPEAPPFRVAEASVEFTRSVLELLAQERRLAQALGADAQEIEPIEQNLSKLGAELNSYEKLVDGILADVKLERLQEIRQLANALAEAASLAARDARALTVARARQLQLGFDETPRAMFPRLFELSRKLLRESDVSLPPIDTDFDETSLTALMARLDLMNARGALADEWRRTKLAADDLKSILNLQARHRLITQNQTSQPLELDFDESRTEVSVTLDTPLNRRSQRNTFREQLLNYQLARRNVLGLEDGIKQDIRAELRSISLSREQHTLSIASAALAYERVVSTELQLRLGVAGVAARDYLEAQTAYANSLSAVASRHISYILGRITLFTDLEQLQLDPYGRWHALHDPLWHPQIGNAQSSWPGYGDLPWGLHYSKELTQRSQRFWSPDTPAATDPATATRE